MTLIYETTNKTGFIRIAGKSYVIENNKVVIENATDSIKLILDRHPNLKLIEIRT